MGQLEARASFLAPNGRFVPAGETLDASDPVVVGRERLFLPVEQATAAPGEVRNVVRYCDVDGCDYSGGVRGLRIHKGRAH